MMRTSCSLAVYGQSEHRLAKALAGIFATIVLIFCAGFALWASDYLAANRDNAIANMTAQSTEMSEEAERVLSPAKLLLSTADRWIAQNPTVDPRTSPNFAQSVGYLLLVVNHSMQVRLADSAGQLSLIPPGTDVKTVNILNRDYFQSALEASPGVFQVSRPYVGRVTGKPMISIATGLSQPYRDVVVIDVGIELQLFERAFERSGLRLDRSIVLLNNDGSLLTRIGPQQGTVETKFNDDPLFIKDMVFADHRSATGITRSSEHEPMLRSYSRVRGYPMVIALEQPVALMEQQCRLVIRVVGGALLLLTLIGAVALWILLRLLVKLSQSRSDLATLANQDHLTGIMNRRRFLEVCDEALTQMRRTSDEHCLVIADIDHFKKINDTYGHPAGDQALKLFTSTCKAMLRETDHVGRLGGEEFGMLLTNIDMEATLQLVERLRKHVSEQRLMWNGTPVRITASFGISQFFKHDADVDAAYLRSDAAMYEAKNTGRNCVCVAKHHAPPVEEPRGL